MFDFSKDYKRKELYFTFKAFSDNIDKLIKRFINLFSSEPEEENFNYAKLVAIEDYRKNKDQNFRYYIFSMFHKLKNIKTEDYDKIISELNEITFSEFVDFHKNILALLKTINFDIVGNINLTLVELIHNYIKEKIIIKDKFSLFNKPLVKEDDSSYVINYYQKSTLNEPLNGIAISYEIPENSKISGLINLFNSCFKIIALNYLRFNYTNAYTPFSTIIGNYFYIYEEGLYKEVDQMEDDINKVLLNIIEGKINVSFYNEIKQSYLLEGETKTEKNMDYLFELFKREHNKQENGESIKLNDELKIPETFKELVDIMAPMFTKPKRDTILVARNTLSDSEFETMFQRRREIKEYLLNKTINITHTQKMIP